MCSKCKDKEIKTFLRAKGCHIGLYCSGCGKWIKWVSKNQLNNLGIGNIRPSYSRMNKKASFDSKYELYTNPVFEIHR
jgi:hypothetical protein